MYCTHKHAYIYIYIYSYMYILHFYLVDIYYTHGISAPSPTFREVPRGSAFGLRRRPAADRRGARGGAYRGEQATWPGGTTVEQL